MAQVKLNVYESIMERIKRDIMLGIIIDGQKLPSCRELAMEMGVNPNTVQKAYSTLEEQGIIFTIPKKGVYARSAPNVITEAENQIRLFRKAGVTREQLQKIIELIYSEDKND